MAPLRLRTAQVPAEIRGARMANKTVRSVCPYCGVGCGIVMQVEDNRVVKVTGDKTHPANFGRLCTKGTTCGKAIAESGRMENAYLRQERSRDPVRMAMDSAISETAARLRNILDHHGPDALSFYVSGQMSLEAQYLINKLAKGFVRTANLESNSRLCMASASSGYKLSLGADGPAGSYQDFDRSNLFFVIGANMADCHPILFLRMMDRVKAGAKLIVVDPRRSATADKADLFLPIKPGTDLALLNGLLHLLVKTATPPRPSSPPSPKAGRPCPVSSRIIRRPPSPKSPACLKRTSARPRNGSAKPPSG